jgi:flagellin-like hook-associated protein FlgL
MAVTNIYLTAGIRENLFSLQQTEKAMETTQLRLATGLKVNSALDDPIAFFAAQAHRQRSSDLAALKDGMNESIQTVKAADVGIEGLIDLVAQIKSLVTAYQTADTAGQTELDTQYAELLSQMTALAADANYKGTNLLDSTDSLVVTFDEAGSNTLTIAGIDVTNATLAIDSLDLSNAAASNTALDAALSTLRTASQTLSSNLAVVTTRLDFTQNMINTLETGADNLTLADMNEESAKLLMLETRQSLATTSLGMASDAAQAILRLFQ